MSMNTVMVFIGLEEIVLTEEMHGRDYTGAIHIVTEFKGKFKEQPTKEKFVELVKSIEPNAQFGNVDLNYDVGAIGIECLWIFNGTGKRYSVKF